jgi:rSAM/selenodomain-associated transferase 1
MKPTIAAAVMAKLPTPGAAKTRLVPALGAEGAARLAAALLADALAALRGARAVAPAFAVAGDMAAAARLAPGIAVLPQRGEDLSARMLNAAADLLGQGHDGVLLFGADTLGLAPADLDHAAALLAAPGDRLVLGPSADGGYWLVGMRRATGALFDGMAWSHRRVLADQLGVCARLGLPASFAATRTDCDAPEDLPAAARLGGPATRAWLAAQLR